MTDYVVCCTARGAHGSVTLARLIREGDDVREQLTRQMPAPWKADADLTVDGEVMRGPSKMIGPVEPTRLDSPAEQWRWRCPKCRRDKPMNGVNLRRWMDAGLGVSLDISLLPR